MISESKGFIFVHIPKTAGNSIQTALRPYADDEFTTPNPFHDGVERFEIRNKKYPKLRKHSGISDYRRALGPAGVSCMTVLTCVRNPWDRAVSFYFSPHRGVAGWDRGAFVRFLDEIPTMVSYLAYRQRFRRRVWHPDLVLRFESLTRAC